MILVKLIQLILIKLIIIRLKNAKAKVFVADIVDRNNKNRNKHRNDAQKRRKERKEWTIINNIDKRNDDDGYNDEAENGKVKDLGNLADEVWRDNGQYKRNGENGNGKRNDKRNDFERDDKAVYRKGFNDKVERNKTKDLGSRFL